MNIPLRALSSRDVLKAWKAEMSSSEWGRTLGRDALGSGIWKVVGNSFDFQPFFDGLKDGHDHRPHRREGPGRHPHVCKLLCACSEGQINVVQVSYNLVKKEELVSEPVYMKFISLSKALAATMIDVKAIVAELGLESGTPLFFQQAASTAVCRFFPSHRSWSPSASGNCAPWID